MTVSLGKESEGACLCNPLNSAEFVIILKLKIFVILLHSVRIFFSL